MAAFATRWSSSPVTARAGRPNRRGAAVRAVVVAVLVACGSAAGSAPAGQAQEPAPRSVIFVNGDGMASAQREAGRLSGVGLDGDLEMDKLPQAGLLTTDSRDPKTFVTDSAAAATT